jgi:2-octaprenyl-6-methoxyphenol hydroxylase
MKLDYDIIIVGGGMVGASLACALEGQGLRIAVIESVPYKSQEQPSYDDRSIALAYGSHRIFSSMNLWQQMADLVEPIRKIHISDRGHFGVTRLDCKDEGTDALGYVIENRVLGKVLNDRLAQLDNVELLCPAELQQVEIREDKAYATVNFKNAAVTLNASLLIAADGVHSTVREQLGIKVINWGYGQTAIITNITPQKHHQNVAYERFTETGPLAVLPMHAHSQIDTEPRCSLVWTVGDEQVDEIMALDDEDFLDRLQQRFGQRLGTIRKCGKRHAYPLSMVRAEEHIRPRLALIGNAAHTLHPVAGQGFNLGIRDVAALAELLSSAHAKGKDLGSMEVLQDYAAWRKRDHRSVIAFTDTLARVFSNSLLPVSLVRNLGLLTVDLMPSLKHSLVKRTMGLSGRLPRLARGLSLMKNIPR